MGGIAQGALSSLFKQDRAPGIPQADDLKRGLMTYSEKEGFMKYEGATPAIQSRYSPLALADSKAIKRIVRPITLPAGTPIFKFTGGLDDDETSGPLAAGSTLTDLMKRKVLLRFSTISPWWSTVNPFEEEKDSGGGIYQAYRDCQHNVDTFGGNLTMREWARFSSAVKAEWNSLSYYVQLSINKPLGAYWGQFQPMKSLQRNDESELDFMVRFIRGEDSAGTAKVTRDGSKFCIQYKNESKKYYLPETLGGMGSWQLYIPYFTNDDVTWDSLRVIPANDMNAMKTLLTSDDWLRLIEDYG